ncbi:MAG: hypothetical protein IJ105_05850 [Bacilli bacterium]|nr:hypothetical protein [Bacilli bacterium]
MKNYLKIFLLIVIILITSGCSGNYNLKINPDLSIDENLELSIDNDNNAYDRTLKIFENNNIPKDNYDVSISSDKVIIEYNDKFSSIEDYLLNSKVYKQLFDKIEYNKNKKYVDLYVDQNIKIKNNYTKNNGSNLTDFDFIQINITNPYKMILTNADMVNDNIYTWSLTKDNYNKKIQMQFKPSFNKFPYRPIIVGSLILIISLIMTITIIRRYKNTQKV